MLRTVFSLAILSLVSPLAAAQLKIVVAGRAGGILSQIRDGETGFLVDSARGCAEACLAVLADPARAGTLALAGKEDVRHRFLMPRLLRDWLALFNRLLGTGAGDTRLATVGEAG